MSDNVVALPGVNLPSAPVNSEVVAMLERWLGDAKSGKLRAVALCGIMADEFRATSWCKSTADENNLAAAIAALNWRYSEYLEKGS
jgi:hypothetical protein